MPVKQELDVIIDGLNLGRGMSFKNIAGHLPFGGCKATVTMDPLDLDNMEIMGVFGLCSGQQYLFSILFVMSFGSGAIAKLQIIGLGFFDFFDGIASLCMCLGAILMLAYIIFRWGFKKFKEEANAGAIGKIRIYDWMKPYLWYIFPVVLLITAVCIIRLYV